jgi:hypothetical protein
VSKRTSFSLSKTAKAALGKHGFIAHTPDLLGSAAWRGRSIHLMRLLDFFELEHLAHAGKENGFLCGTYMQMVAHGVTRRYIKPATEEGVARGLLKVIHQGGYRGTGRNDPSTYRLTYLPWKFIPATGPPQYLEPTNEWKSFAGPKPMQKPRPFAAIKKPNGHPSPQQPQRQMKTTKRKRERERYLKINALTYGLKDATERWATYVQLIFNKYGRDDLENAWKTRDRAHQAKSV